jgi:hypothetical protein
MMIKICLWKNTIESINMDVYDKEAAKILLEALIDYAEKKSLPFPRATISAEIEWKPK